MASSEQEYLIAVVKPCTAMLTPLWLSSLQEYARLRFEPDISGALGTSPLSSNLDEVYAALNRETLLKVNVKRDPLILSRSLIMRSVLPGFVVKSC